MADVRMSEAAARTVNNRFEDVSAEFFNSVGVIGTVASQLTSGAGEFSGAMADGSATFEISWREAFRVCGTTAGVIAGNTNQMSVDLARLDRDASTTIRL